MRWEPIQRQVQERRMQKTCPLKTGFYVLPNLVPCQLYTALYSASAKMFLKKRDGISKLVLFVLKLTSVNLPYILLCKCPLDPTQFALEFCILLTEWK